MKTFDRHKKNLRQVGDAIWSYSTHVATLVYNSKKLQYELHQHGWWSVTTQKHINYVANYYDINVVVTNYDNPNYSA
jgi:hypothetical protein